MSFVHLNVRSHFSIGQSILRIEDLVERASTLGMPAVALTDDCNLFGAVPFVKACALRGIKPILGAALRVGAGLPTEADKHLIVLARNAEGFANLRTLVTRAHLDQPEQNRPRVHPKILESHTAGLIALVGGSAGRLGDSPADDDTAGAQEAIQAWTRVFPEGGLYLELDAGEGPGPRQINQGLIALSATTGVPLVATAPIRYLDPEDAAARKIQVEIVARALPPPKQVAAGSGDESHLATPAWMAIRFANQPDALANTLQIAERIEDDLLRPPTQPILPDVPVPEGTTPAEHMAELARKGLAQRLMRMRLDGLDPDESQYRTRLEYEVALVADMGFERYFLTWWEIVTWARQREVLVGPGRASAAGSLLLFALGITGIDPVAHGLVFERFLSPKRTAWPDIDLDVCMDCLDPLRDHIQTRFGRDRVAHVAFFAHWHGRQLLQQVAEAMDLEDHARELIQSFSATHRRNPNRLCDREPHIDEQFRADPKMAELWDTAVRLDGTPCHADRHAAALVIADRPIDKVVPLFLPGEGLPVTQFDRRDIEDAGLPTYDLLGLTTLSQMNDTEASIRKNLAPDFRVERIPPDDFATFDRISAGDINGVFQFENRGIRQMTQQMQPRSILDLAAIIVLFRPGSLTTRMDERYQEVRSGRRQPIYLHPALEPILRETEGLLLFQEQLMHIAHDLGGLDMADADLMRRAMGKLDSMAIEPFRAAFLQGAKERGIEPLAAGEVLRWMEHLAPHTFPKAHATAYATLSYRMAYLKTHYPEACDW